MCASAHISFLLSLFVSIFGNVLKVLILSLCKYSRSVPIHGYLLHVGSCCIKRAECEQGHYGHIFHKKRLCIVEKLSLLCGICLCKRILDKLIVSLGGISGLMGYVEVIYLLRKVNSTAAESCCVGRKR